MPQPETRTEVIERLRGRASQAADWRNDAVPSLLASLLTEAADLLEAGESRTEYRVVASDGFTVGRFGQLETTREELDRLEVVYSDVGLSHRIQRSELTRTPWVDVEAGGEGE